MNDMWTDWTMWNYLLTLIVCFYGAGLFGWWAGKAGRPSAVFLYVMGIFIAEGWAMGVAIQARYLHFYGATGGYADYVANSPLWAFRQLPTTIVLAALAIHMSFRAFVVKKRRETNGMEHEDLVKKYDAAQAARKVVETAILAAEIVAVASAVAAKKVTDEARKATALAEDNADHIMTAIKRIQKERSGD